MKTIKDTLKEFREFIIIENSMLCGLNKLPYNRKISKLSILKKYENKRNIKKV